MCPPPQALNIGPAPFEALECLSILDPRNYELAADYVAWNPH
jgi:hypothetical protein